MKLLSVLLSVASVSGLVSPIGAETGVLASLSEEETRREYIGKTEGSPSPIVPQSPSQSSSIDLVGQGITRVTDVEVIQTESGLELVLKTIAGSERLVPLILPEGNDLVIDILDATLTFSVRNGVTELNPAPGIRRVTVNKAENNSIRVRITGENQTPSAEVVPGRDDLVLSVTPETAKAEQEPDEEIEVIATGQGQEGSDYFVPDAGITRNDTPIINTPSTVQVIPRQVFEDRGATEFRDALSRNAVGVVTNGLPRSNFSNVLIRGFDVSNSTLLNGVPQTFFTFSPPRELSNVEQLEILSGSASIIGGQVSPGGVINIVTKQPSLEPFYDLSVSYDTLDSIEGALDLSGSFMARDYFWYPLYLAK